MADSSSSVVAVVAIVIIVVVGIGVAYVMTNGFQFNKGSTTVVAPKVDVVPSTGGKT